MAARNPLTGPVNRLLHTPGGMERQLGIPTMSDRIAQVGFTGVNFGRQPSGRISMQ
jgi:hypothetical protein